MSGNTRGRKKGNARALSMERDDQSRSPPIANVNKANSKSKQSGSRSNSQEKKTKTPRKRKTGVEYESENEQSSSQGKGRKRKTTRNTENCAEIIQGDLNMEEQQESSQNDSQFEANF